MKTKTFFSVFGISAMRGSQNEVFQQISNGVFETVTKLRKIFEFFLIKNVNFKFMYMKMYIRGLQRDWNSLPMDYMSPVRYLIIHLEATNVSATQSLCIMGSFMKRKKLHD